MPWWSPREVTALADTVRALIGGADSEEEDDDDDGDAADDETEPRDEESEEDGHTLGAEEYAVIFFPSQTGAK